MIAAILFGIALAPLFAAIAEVESENGKTSDNVYQLRRIYLDDVGRIYGCHFSDEVMTDRFSSERVMLAYMEHYGERYHRRTGKLPTVEVLARIHNGGPDGWKKPSTETYWNKVKAVMDAKRVKTESEVVK